MKDFLLGIMVTDSCSTPSGLTHSLLDLFKPQIELSLFLGQLLSFK